MRNPGKGRLLTFEPSSGNWRKNLGTDIRNGSVKRYPIIGIPFGLRPHSIPIMGNDTVNGILPRLPVSRTIHCPLILKPAENVSVSLRKHNYVYLKKSR